MPVGLGLLWLAMPPIHRTANAQLRGFIGTLEPEGADARTSGELTDCGVDAANSRTQLGRGHSVHESLAARETTLLCAETYRPRRILGPIRTERDVRTSANPTGMAAPINGPFGIGRVRVDGPLINAGTERSPPDGDRITVGFGTTSIRHTKSPHRGSMTWSVAAAESDEPSRRPV